MKPVAVIFRMWRDTGDVFALFPEIPSDINGWYCDSYTHVGQHGGADYYGIVRQTVPAAPAECAALSVELERIGYRLRPMNRVSWRLHEERRVAARVFREADAGCGAGTKSPTR